MEATILDVEHLGNIRYIEVGTNKYHNEGKAQKEGNQINLFGNISSSGSFRKVLHMRINSTVF